MSKGKTIIRILGVLSGIGLIIYIIRRYRLNQMDARVAEEGYETAYDILFPEKRDNRKKKQYGPVIPGRLVA